MEWLEYKKQCVTTTNWWAVTRYICHMLIKFERSCSSYLNEWIFLLSKPTMKIKTDSHSQNLVNIRHFLKWMNIWFFRSLFLLTFIMFTVNQCFGTKSGFYARKKSGIRVRPASRSDTRVLIVFHFFSFPQQPCGRSSEGTGEVYPELWMVQGKKQRGLGNLGNTKNSI